MSQVKKKLQAGGNAPKQKYGKLIIDSREYEATPEMMQALGSYISGLNPKHQRFLGDIEEALRSGKNISLNTHTNRLTGLSGFSELNDSQNRRSREGRTNFGKFIGAITDSDVNQSNEAIALLGRFNYIQPTVTSQSSKTKVNNDILDFDYDTVDDKYVYSSNPKNDYIKNRFQYYYDWLDDEDQNAWNNTYEWSATPSTQNEAILRSWFNGLGTDSMSRRTAAKAAIDAALKEVANANGWENVSEKTKELLSYFNIGTNKPTGQEEPVAKTVVTNPYTDSNGQIQTNAQNEKGQWGVYEGNGENGTVKGAKYTTFDAGSLPYLINKDRLNLFEGLDDSYLDSIIFNKRIYKPSEIDQNVQLQRIMQEVAQLNASATNASDLYNALKQRINYTDYGDSIQHYLNYDSSKHYLMDKAVREYLKNTPYAAIFNPTPAYGVTDNEKIYGIYDFGRAGTGAYGFRNPYYLIVGADGQLYVKTDGNSEYSESELPFDALNKNWGDASGFVRMKETINGKPYVRIEATDRVNGGNYHFVIDEQTGEAYHVTNNGKLEPIDAELLQRLLNGEQIVPADVDASKKKAKKSIENREKAKRGWHPPVTGRKNGGRIRELPVKLQSGSKFLTQSSEIKDLGPISDRMSEASEIAPYKWEELSDADKNDVRAVGLDLLGAVLSLSPDPYTAAAGIASGIGATGLMTSADIAREDFNLGRTAVSAGMDILGALPIVGTTAKFAKIGKALSRSPKLLKTLSGLFIGAGFASAVPTLNKLIKEGPKSLTTDDLYALSGAVQASLGVGVRARQRAGDSRLANLISNTEAAKKSTVTTTSTGHSARMKYASDIDVKLKDADVAEIRGAGENAGTVLRQKLQESYNVDPASLEADNAALLRRFGFELKDGVPTPIEGTTHSASSKRIKGGTEDTFKLEQDDVDYVLAGGENAGVRLRERLVKKGVDASLINTDDKALLKQFGFDVKMTKGETPKIASVTETKPSVKERVSGTARQILPKDNYTKRGYLTDLWRGASKRRAYIDQAMQTPEIRAEIDQALAKFGPDEGILAKRAYGRSQYRIGEDEIGTVGRGKYYSYVKEEPVAEVTETQPAPVTETPTPAPQTTPAPETPVTPQPQVQVAPENPVQSAMRKAYETPAMIDIRERNAGRRAAKLQDVAANIKKLQNSKDPMKTLSELNSKVDKFDEMVFNNQEEFQAALNYALSHMSKNGKTKSRYYENQLAKFLDDNNLVIFTKKGGIIKAQNGLSLYPNGLAPQIKKRTVQLPFLTNVEVSAPKPITIPAYKNPYSGEETNMFTGEQVAKPTWQRTSLSPTSDDSIDTLGHWNINAKIGHNAIEQGLGWYQYFRDLRDQKKYEQNQIKALNASRVQDQAARANHFTYDNPAFDRAEANLRNENMRGFKAITSDVNAYNAQQQSAWGKLLDAQQKLTAQRSAADAQINMQNAEIDRQNAMNEVATANQNRKTNAAIDAAIFNAQNERILREQQSRQNKILEIRNNLANDRKLMSQMNLSGLSEEEQYKLNSEIDKLFPNARLEYENLPDGQTEYASFEDYIAKKYPELWKQNASRLRELNTAAQNRMRQAGLTMQLNYPSLMGLAQSSSIGAYKKGGYLRGSTRYTKEPDEQIWIDNNKAAHRAVAKLEDNIIKLLLRALK